MTLADITTQDIDAAVRRSLITEYGDKWWAYPLSVKPASNPMVVVYERDGKTYRRTVVMEFVGELPNAILGGEEAEVVARTIYVDVPQEQVKAAFSATPSEDGRTKPEGLLFRAGDFGAKGTYTAKQLAQFVENFPSGGVPIRDNHSKEAFFTACLADDNARLAKVWTSADGNELHGQWDIPAWAADAARNRIKKASIKLVEPARDRLEEVSLVLTPHIEDAAVFDSKVAAAFSASKTFPAFAAARPDDAAKIVDVASKAPAPASPMPLNQEQLWAQFSQIPGNEGKKAEFDALFAKTTAPDTDPRVAEMQRKIEQMEADQKAQFKATADKEDELDALSFYGDLLRAGKATEATKPAVLAEFSNARFRDRHTLAQFSANADGSEEAKIRKRYEEAKPMVHIGAGRLDSTAQVAEFSSPLGVFSRAELGLKEDK